MKSPLAPVAAPVQDVFAFARAKATEAATVSLRIGELEAAIERAEEVRDELGEARDVADLKERIAALSTALVDDDETIQGERTKLAKAKRELKRTEAAKALRGLKTSLRDAKALHRALSSDVVRACATGSTK